MGSEVTAPECVRELAWLIAISGRCSVRFADVLIATSVFSPRAGVEQEWERPAAVDMVYLRACLCPQQYATSCPGEIEDSTRRWVDSALQWLAVQLVDRLAVGGGGAWIRASRRSDWDCNGSPTTKSHQVLNQPSAPHRLHVVQRGRDLYKFILAIREMKNRPP